ncbi:alpha/beta hydrolase [Lacinutrix sp. MedPE-SW]|uniref:alpha/beta hydrolase family protein n=1 Tax=Lacinutrix sp. MedPE-SW TaxID=1860087 RepID=UPI00091660A2|nr:alpha/beta hydrolase [Lacinutrix sp. MedPE-SW]OIQ23418.1 MAG: alpha/beta hydrolase [Lacinutrix sp. MedPE-SW]
MISKNLVLKRKIKKPIVFDLFFKENTQQKPIIIFCHGYKGFKDWGSWDLVAKTFMEANLFFVKFNFSHNGGTINNPIDFPDLDAFAENNYTKELDDLDAIINHLLSSKFKYRKEIDVNNITVIGHSRGGGISIIKASEDSRLSKLITWASVCNFSKRSSTIGDLENWRKTGVKYVLNGRTNQKMPHNFQFYEDFKANENRLNIENAAKKLKIPFLIIHAKNDPSIKFHEAECLNSWNAKSELFIVNNSDHVFGAKHPWQNNTMPEKLKQVVEKSISFIFN